MIDVLFNRVWSHFLSYPFVNWYVKRVMRGFQIRKDLLNKYVTSDEDINIKHNYIICIYDGTVKAGGLADRLRGILSTYSICKKNNLQFKLFFNSPFNLEDFLVPNQYDWRIDSSAIVYSRPFTQVVVLDSTQNNEYHATHQKHWLEKKLIKQSGQKHVYTNAFFSYYDNYSCLFAELFKPSVDLQSAIDRQLKLLGMNYISVSCRFLDLLGDFNESFGAKVKLNGSQKNTLLKKIEDKIIELHSIYPEYKVLCNSDSALFLNKVRQNDFVYVVDGNITHIDNVPKNGEYKLFEKTFLDFFMIANAKKIYQIKGDYMHNSGYPYAASKLYNRPYECIVL